MELLQLAAAAPNNDGAVVSWVKDALRDVKSIAVLAAGVMAVVATVLAYWKTKSWGATLTAAVLGAVVIFLVGNMNILSKMVDTEVPEEGEITGSARVVQLYEPGDIAANPAVLR